MIKKSKNLRVNKAIRVYTLEEIKDKHLGKKGTGKRDAYELQLSEDVLRYKLGETLKSVRLRQQLTQEQLGDKIGVQKAQISRLEKSMENATLSTIMKVFKSLDVDVKVSIRIPNS
jgi:DNA-binding XRE family transcriptional regulator